jgi:hypothetical protein
MKYRPAVVTALRVGSWNRPAEGPFGTVTVAGKALYDAVVAALPALGPPPNADDLNQLLDISIGVQARHYAIGFEEDRDSLVGVVESIEENEERGAQVLLRLDGSRTLGGGTQKVNGWELEVIREEDRKPKTGPRPDYGPKERQTLEAIVEKVDWLQRPEYPFAARVEGGRWFLIDTRSSLTLDQNAVGKRFEFTYYAPKAAPMTAALRVAELNRVSRRRSR